MRKIHFSDKIDRNCAVFTKQGGGSLFVCAYCYLFPFVIKLSYIIIIIVRRKTMKRKAKLLSLLLALCLIFGLVAVGVSAATSADELDSDYYLDQLKPSGATNYFAITEANKTLSISGQLGSTSSNEIVEVKDADGNLLNKYLSLHRTTGSDYSKEESGYRGLNVGGSSSKVTDYGLAINGKLLKSAFVFDIDICADRYVYVTDDGAGNKTYETLTPAALEERGLTPESEGVDLAFVSGDRVYMQSRYWTTSPAEVSTSASATGAKSMNVYFNKDTATGKWFFSDAASISKAKATYEMSNEVGVFDHITYVVIPGIETVVEEEKEVDYVTCDVYVFINGEYFNALTTIPASIKAKAINVEEFRITINNDAKKVDCYSYGVDNYTANYYNLTYSADGYGIDDFVKYPTSTNIFSLNDIVANSSYVSPNGYLQVKNLSDGDRKLVSFKGLLASELAKIEDDAVVYTDFDLEEIEIPDGVTRFTIECDPAKVSVSLSEASYVRGFIAKATDSGYDVLVNDTKVTLEWYDLKGDLIETTVAPIGYSVNTEGKITAYVEDDKLYNADEIVWTWNLDGEVGEITDSIASDGQIVKMIPTGDVKELEGASFVMGTYNEDYTKFIPAPASDGTYSFYVDASGKDVLAECAKLTYGNTCLLLRNFTGIDGDAAAADSSIVEYKIPTGEVLNFDLNGKIFVKTGLCTSDNSQLFTVTTGAQLNFFSSEAGAEVFVGHIRNSSSRVDQVMSAAGIAKVNANDDDVIINIGALLDGEGNVIFDGDNLTFNGGTLFIYGGPSTTENLSDDKSIKVNIIGGTYNYIFRGSYSLITLQGPDAKIYIDGIKMYGNYTSSSISHEYSGMSTQGTEVTVKNSEIYTNYAFYRTAYGNYYVENNVFASAVGFIQSMGGGNFVIGKDNVFAGSVAVAKSDIFDFKNITFADGVSYASPKTGDPVYDKLTKAYDIPPITLAWAPNFDFVLKDGASVADGVIDALEELSSIASFKFKESVFTTKNTLDLSYDVKLVTFDEENLPEGVVLVIWQNADGDFIETTYEYVGNKATAPFDVTEAGVEDSEYSWCISKYVWQNVMTEDYSIVEDGNIFVPTETYIALDALTMKANMSLGDGMIFNIYIITPDGIEDDITVDGALSYGEKFVDALGGSYYVISVAEPIDSFSKSTVTLSFTVSGYEISYKFTVDALKYVSAVVGEYECGTDEAALAYQIAAYKLAAAEYTGATVSDEDAERVNTFLTLFDAHESCVCCGAFSEELLTEEELDVNYIEAFAGKVNSVAYLLNPEYIGIRFDVAEGAVLNSVTYISVDGETKSASVKYVEDGYYVVSGISAADARAVMTVSVTLGDDTAIGTYSLGKYVMNRGDELAKALWSYSLAAYNYKVVLASEITE